MQPRAVYEHLYVHVPFCVRRCSYCDFSIAVRRAVPTRAFARAVASELTVRGIARDVTALQTLYLGGGTPSRLGADGVAELLDAIATHAPLAAGAEVTLEANPEDVTPKAVAAWRASGVNRLSLGVQSFDDRVLRWMHRVHDAEGARRAVRVATDGGFMALSLDLIFALPDALERDWARDVDLLLALEPAHVSLYGLTVEPHTPLGRWRERGDVIETEDDRYAYEFVDSHERLRAAGFEHYEVSNFARSGQRARHNSAYWRSVPYLGVGPSAHGFDGRVRRWNIAAYAQWQAAADKGIDPVEGSETLSVDNRVAEAVYLGLRTSAGLTVTPAEIHHARSWLEAGWVESFEADGHTRLRCTVQGWLRLDALASDLTAVRSRS